MVMETVMFGTVQGQMNKLLRENMDRAIKVVKNDWDMVFLVDGSEGSGKSVMALQLAAYCDPKFKLNNVVFNPDEFQKAVINADQMSAVIYDEAFTGLSSRASMTLVNRMLVNMLAEIRQKNLFVFVVMPTFFDLDKYVALWRSRALIHVYSGDNFERGMFAFYNIDLKKGLYINGKKFYDYKGSKTNFTGRFYNTYPIDEMAYRKKKREALRKRQSKSVRSLQDKEVEREIFKRLVELGDGIPNTVKADLLGVSHKTYYNWLSELKETGLIDENKQGKFVKFT